MRPITLFVTAAFGFAVTAANAGDYKAGSKTFLIRGPAPPRRGQALLPVT
jgi:hypothetical protein